MPLVIEMAESEFTCLLGGEDRTGTVEDTTEFTYTDAQLATANILVPSLLTWMKKQKKHGRRDSQTDKNLQNINNM